MVTDVTLANKIKGDQSAIFCCRLPGALSVYDEFQGLLVHLDKVTMR